MSQWRVKAERTPIRGAPNESSPPQGLLRRVKEDEYEHRRVFLRDHQAAQSIRKEACWVIRGGRRQRRKKLVIEPSGVELNTNPTGKARAQCAFQCYNPTATAQPRVLSTQNSALALRKLLRMAGTTWELVVLSSSPLVADAQAATSPPNVDSTRRVAMSAPSPLSLSPPASPKKRAAGASKPNLKAATIPEGAVRGFATVGKLVQSEYFAEQPDEKSDARQQVPSRRESLECIGKDAPATTKPRKRPTKKRAAEGTEQPKPKPKPRARKAKADTDKPLHDPELRLPVPTESPFFANDAAETPIEPRNGSETAAAKLTKSGKPRKTRAKKQKPECSEQEPGAGSTLKGHRAAPRKRVAKGGKLQREATSTASAHFRGDTDKFEALSDEVATVNTVGNQHGEYENASTWDIPGSPRATRHAAPKQRPPDLLAEGLDLEEAVTRRRDWTPPPEDTATQIPTTDSVGKENRRLVSDGSGNFTHLVSNFAYAQSPPIHTRAAPATLVGEITVVPKRRRVELVEVPNQQTNSRNSSPEKGRGPKKKPRTITDLVTKQYAPKMLDPPFGHVTSDFFQTTTTMKAPLNDTTRTELETPLESLPSKRATSKLSSNRAPSKPKSKKKSAKSKPIIEQLLSPASALRRMNRQDVLFGTSSQLALEDSPTTIRQLQLAMKTSEDADVSGRHDTAPAPQWPRLGKMMGIKGHWAASARDDEGGILEHTDMVCTLEPDRTQDFPLLMDGTHDELDEATTFVDIDDIKYSPAVLISSKLPTPSRNAPPISPIVNTGSLHGQTKGIVFDDIDSFEQEPPPSNQNADSQHQFADIDDFILSPSSQMDISPLPKSEPASTLTKITDGSPKKRRGRPSKYQSTHIGTFDSITSAVPFTVSEAKTVMKASTVPSTPPKPTTRFVDIEEILDSEEEALEAFSPTPPRIRRLQDVPSLTLFSSGPVSPKAITKSISKSSSNADLIPILRVPSSHLQWTHIKDQVYKQLTAHIRSLPSSSDTKRPSWHEKILMYEPIVLEDFTAYLNAQTRIRTYKKATQKQIKAWNQMLKRTGEAMLAVSEDEEEVLVIEKELEPYMAQSWCESLSICCIWGEGKGKGGARKGLY